MSDKALILIVDDDPKIRKTLSDILKLNDYEPVAVSGGQEALEAVERKHPAVALIDLRLGDMSGMNVIEAIRASSPETACIVLTGYASRESAIDAIRLGAYSYIEKPYDIEQLLLIVRRAIEKQRADKELQELQEFHERIVSSVTEGILLTNAEGIIDYANPPMAELLAWSVEELVGQHWKAITPPDLYDTIETAYERRGLGEADRYETSILRKDGKTTPVIVSGSSRIDGGQFAGAQALFMDISERKRIVEALRESESRYRALFDDSPISLWEEDYSDVKAYIEELQEQASGDWRTYFETNPEVVRECFTLRKVIDVNRATLTLFEAETKELLIEGQKRKLSEEVLPLFIDEFVALSEGKTHYQGEGIYFTLKDQMINARVEWSVAPGFEETLGRVIVSVIDITESKQAEEELREANRRLEDALVDLENAQNKIVQQERLAAVGQLAAGIAHDFNNILGTIILFSQLILKESKTPPKDLERTTIIFEQALRAASLVSQILDFSRRAVMDRRPMNLVPFLKETEKLLTRTLPENIHVKISCEADGFIVNADPTRMQQFFTNLALNARDAMPDGGELRIALSNLLIGVEERPPFRDMPAGDWVRISLSDTGMGISPDDLPHIFEPFFTTKEPGKGTGLGLAQVYGIVKQHDGYIDVKSEEAKGSTFIVYLPILHGHDVQDHKVDEITIDSGNEETILVVEDDETTRIAVGEILETLNYQSILAVDGREALTIIEEQSEGIDLVLTDLVMPTVSGIAVYNQLQLKHPEIPLVIMTGYPLDSETRVLLEERSITWMQKPLTSHTIARTLNDILVRTR